MRALSALPLVAIVAALAATLVPPLPARSVALGLSPSRPVVAGTFHVHTQRSDGAGTVDQVAEAAARAGLAFVILTDHGDGTRPFLAPAYRSGVLVIDGVEISTDDGHYAAVGLRPSSYPLAGEGRDVAEDVRRLGGFGVAAHGASRREDARWRNWDAPIDGLEWLNLDSVWREAPLFAAARSLITFWVRPSETLAALIGRPELTLARLDRLTSRRRAVALAATDAHGHLVPDYETCFRTVSTRVELAAPLTNQAQADAASLVRALAAGRHYTAIDALARPAAFEFVASSGASTASQGDVLPPGFPVRFEGRVAAPLNATSYLIRDGRVVHQTTSPSWQFEAEGRAGAYRVEVRLEDAGGTRAPWIVSNPIYVGERAVARPSAPTSALVTRPIAWQAEQDGTSTARVARVGASGVRLGFTLGTGPPTNQYVAAAAPVPPDLPAFAGLHLTGRADRPVRVSVQLRADRRPGAPRWQRSIYLDTSERHVWIPFSDLRPVRPAEPSAVPLAAIDTILVLAGLTNSRPSAEGNIDIAAISLYRPAP